MPDASLPARPPASLDIAVIAQIFFLKNPSKNK